VEVQIPRFARDDNRLTATLDYTTLTALSAP
jgi:hypothetical protein